MLTPTFPINDYGRDFVVGDIHGCFRTLERAVAHVKFAPTRDRLFGVGDLVNRGPHSAQALTWLEQHFAAVTRGNHEHWLLDWFKARLLGARPRSAPWQRAIDPSAYQRWCDALSAMPLAVTIETRYGAVGVVHAQTPHPIWRTALEMLESGCETAIDVALLGYETREEEVRAASQPVEELREFLILTASRMAEVLGARWCEIHFERTVWTVPAERTKSGLADDVPLSYRALSVLREAQALSGAHSHGVVFPSRNGNDTQRRHFEAPSPVGPGRRA